MINRIRNAWRQMNAELGLKVISLQASLLLLSKDEDKRNAAAILRDPEFINGTRELMLQMHTPALSMSQWKKNAELARKIATLALEVGEKLDEQWELNHHNNLTSLHNSMYWN